MWLPGQASSRSLRATACLPQSLRSLLLFVDKKFVPNPFLQASLEKIPEVAVVDADVVTVEECERVAEVVAVVDIEKVAVEERVLVWVVLGLVLLQPGNSPARFASNKPVSSLAIAMQSDDRTRRPPEHAILLSPLAGVLHSPITLFNDTAVLSWHVRSDCPFGNAVHPTRLGFPNGHAAIAWLSKVAWSWHDCPTSVLSALDAQVIRPRFAVVAVLVSDDVAEVDCVLVGDVDVRTVDVAVLDSVLVPVVEMLVCALVVAEVVWLADADEVKEVVADVVAVVVLVVDTDNVTVVDRVVLGLADALEDAVEVAVVNLQRENAPSWYVLEMLLSAAATSVQRLVTITALLRKQPNAPCLVHCPCSARQQGC